MNISEFHELYGDVEAPPGIVLDAPDASDGEKAKPKRVKPKRAVKKPAAKTKKAAKTKPAKVKRAKPAKAKASKTVKASKPKRAAKKKTNAKSVKKPKRVMNKAKPAKGRQGVRADGKPRKPVGSILRGDEKTRALGLKIRARRVQLGMSQSVLAGKSGIKQGFMSFVENGQRTNASLIGRIGKALGLKLKAA